MSRVNARQHGALTLVLTSTLWMGCGRTSLDAFQSETQTSTGGSAVGGNGASSGFVAGGSTFVTGGTFGSGGVSSGGSFGQAGTTVVAGQGGFAAGTCSLSPSDCRDVADAACALSNEPCAGDVVNWATLRSLETRVLDIATARDGRVAVGGYVEGGLADVSSVAAAGNGWQGFATLFDANGDSLSALYTQPPAELGVTGVDFTPDGDLVLQGGSDGFVHSPREPLGEVFVSRVAASGDVVWHDSFEGQDVRTGQVAVDNNGDVTMVGWFQDAFEIAGQPLNGSSDASYLARLTGMGAAVWARTVVPPGWVESRARKLVVDDEDSILLVGSVDHAPPSNGYLSKHLSSGDEEWSVALRSTGSLAIDALASDRTMRILIGGTFSGALSILGKTFDAGGEQRAAWVAQLSRNGELNWVVTYPSADPLLSLQAVAVDPHGNVTMAGGENGELYLRKLRPDGSELWLRTFAVGELGQLALAADNASNLWLAADFDGSLYLGPGLGQRTVFASGESTGILLKLSP